MTRTPISLEMSLQDLVVLMSEGNPGALTVLVKIMDRDRHLGPLIILDLEAMNIRGPQIWILYKDICMQDMDVLIHHIQCRTPESIRLLNELAEQNGITHRAHTI